MSTRIVAVIIALVAVCGVSGCAASPTPPSGTATSRSEDLPGDEGQSTEDACALIQERIQEATEEFERAATTDPATAAEAMTAAAERLAASAAEITNDEVAALLPSLEDMFAEVGEVMTEIAQGDVSKVDDLAELGSELRATSEAFQDVCTG